MTERPDLLFELQQSPDFVLQVQSRVLTELKSNTVGHFGQGADGGAHHTSQHIVLEERLSFQPFPIAKSAPAAEPIEVGTRTPDSMDGLTAGGAVADDSLSSNFVSMLPVSSIGSSEMSQGSSEVDKVTDKATANQPQNFVSLLETSSDSQ